MTRTVNALILGGGAIRGAFQVGVTEYLMNQQNLRFDVICGISSGGLNATMLSQAQTPDEQPARLEALKDVWFGINKSTDLWKNKCLSYIRIFFAPPLGSTSLFDVEPLKKIIQSSANIDLLRSSPIKFGVGATNFNTGDYLLARADNPFIEQFLVATSMNALMFPPVEIDGEIWCDGGSSKGLPVDDGIELCREIVQENPGVDFEFNLFVGLAELPLAPQKWENSDLKTGFNIGMRFAELGNFSKQKASLEELYRLEEIEGFPVKKKLVFDATNVPKNPIDQFEVSHKIIKGLYDHGFERAKEIWNENP